MRKRELENKRGFDVEWRTGPKQDYTGILPLILNRQERERKQEEGTKMKKTNIGDRRGTYKKMRNSRDKSTTGEKTDFFGLVFTLYTPENDSARWPNCWTETWVVNAQLMFEKAKYQGGKRDGWHQCEPWGREREKCWWKDGGYGETISFTFIIHRNSCEHSLHT